MSAIDWQSEAGRLATASLAAGDPTGWFDKLWASAQAGSVTMPWDSRDPHSLLGEWGREHGTVEGGKRAVVVGCGLGADAEFVSGLGYSTVAFDVSPTAIELARRRYPDSRVEYQQADLFNLPDGWRRAFDLVADVYTVQALPLAMRPAATAAVADLVAPNGTLVIVMVGREGDIDPADGPPWPLSESEINAFTAHGLTAVNVQRLTLEFRPSAFFWRAEFRRPGSMP
jgi:SAM-dependent methyltransferase